MYDSFLVLQNDSTLEYKIGPPVIHDQILQVAWIKDRWSYAPTPSPHRITTTPMVFDSASQCYKGEISMSWAPLNGLKKRVPGVVNVAIETPYQDAGIPWPTGTETQKEISSWIHGIVPSYIREYDYGKSTLGPVDYPTRFILAFAIDTIFGNEVTDFRIDVPMLGSGEAIPGEIFISSTILLLASSKSIESIDLSLEVDLCECLWLFGGDADQQHDFEMV